MQLIPEASFVFNRLRHGHDDDSDILNMAPAGRRSNGARMPSPPLQSASIPVSNFEPNPSRSSKTRLNLLNPMTLLARRRTSQAVPQVVVPPVARNSSSATPGQPFDPSIRGTRVHDFDSAPRPRRNVSYNDVQQSGTDHSLPLRSPNLQSAEYGKSIGDNQLSPWSGGQHTPVFTEDFEEEQYPAAGPHVRKASDLSDLTVPRPPYAKESRPQSSPAPSTTQDSSVIPEKSARRPSWGVIAVDSSPPVPPQSITISEVAQSKLPEDTKKISINAPTPPRSSPSSIKTRSRNVSGGSTKDFLLNGAAKPRHQKSTSSRFSFDMIGAAKQEKLLEDRHRQKALEQRASSPIADEDDAQFEDFDYDAMLDDDGLEERIPGVNADADDDDYFSNLEEDIPGVNTDLLQDDLYGCLEATGGEDIADPTTQPVDMNISPPAEGVCEGFNTQGSVAGFTFNNLGISTSTTPMSPLSPPAVSTPRDANGAVIGFAVSKESPIFKDHKQRPLSKDWLRGAQSPPIEHNPSPQHDMDVPGLHWTILTAESAAAPGTSNMNNDDDDMYFDDGMIDFGEDGGEAPEFDESVFDNDDTDQYGRPARPVSSLPTLYSPPYIHNDPQTSEPSKPSVSTSGRSSREPLRLSIASGKSVTFETSGSLHHSRIDEDSPMFHQPVSLTHDTLSAYQSALAAAAYEAVANGRLRRDSGPATQHDERDEFPARRSSLDGLPQTLEHNLEEDDFDYDDALADDDIIAEANAEALASDSDGFYGQEFGFYSAPVTGEALFANGGYFGLRGDGFIRTKSGRVVREPSLTPITERSEYSNRNSLMSLPQSAHGYVASPNLTQLAGMMGDYDDENMSISALLKMRRGAWGGSQASVRSSNGDGSPLDAVAEENNPGDQSTFSPNSAFSHNLRRNSALSIGLTSEAPSSAPASPTLTLSNMATSMSMGPPAPPSQMVNSLRDRPLSPRFAGAVGMVSSNHGERETAFGKQGRSHRHTGSADSISYLEEDDPIAGKRWVLERRRTAESGEIEVLGRQIISGGRI